MDDIYRKALDAYGQWLCEQIDNLIELESDSHETTLRFAANVVKEAGDRGLKLGLTGLYEATRIDSNLLDATSARLGLECCLAKAHSPKKEVNFSVDEFVRRKQRWQGPTCRE